MKTLKEIKDEIARKYNCKYWVELCGISSKDSILYFNDVATLRFAKEVAKQALINASENAFCFYEHKIQEAIVDKQSILNESNIPEL